MSTIEYLIKLLRANLDLVLKESNISHKNSKVGHVTRTYMAWLNMKNRCNNSKHPKYSLYGGRGIKVCKSGKIPLRLF